MSSSLSSSSSSSASEGGSGLTGADVLGMGLVDGAGGVAPVVAGAVGAPDGVGSVGPAGRDVLGTGDCSSVIPGPRFKGGGAGTPWTKAYPIKPRAAQTRAQRITCLIFLNPMATSMTENDETKMRNPAGETPRWFGADLDLDTMQGSTKEFLVRVLVWLRVDCGEECISRPEIDRAKPRTQ